MGKTYLAPSTVAKLHGLELKARRIVEGTVAGLHKSPYHGFSAEFAEHREYVPGDDLRYVDWKVYGKRDRYYLKQHDEERNFACYLLLDTSESMRYRSANAPLSKLEYAQLIAAALAYLIVHQQDAVGLVTFDTTVSRFVGAASQSSHLHQLFQVMEQTPASGETSLGPILHEIAERIRKRGLIIVISDLFDDPDSLLLGLKHLHYRRHDVDVLQIIDPAERDFPFTESMACRGMEGFPTVLVEPRFIKKAYQVEFDRFVTTMRRGCHALQIGYDLLPTDRPLDLALSSFLQTRLHRG